MYKPIFCHIFWMAAVVIGTLALPLNAFAQQTTETTVTVSVNGVETTDIVEIMRTTLRQEVAMNNAFNHSADGFARTSVSTTSGNSGESIIIQSGGEVFVWNTQIAEMLDFTPEQSELVRNAARELERPGQGTAGEPTWAERIVEMQEKVDESLLPEQRMLFRELGFQLADGLNSRVLNERTLDFLELTPTQREQIQQLAREVDVEADATRRALIILIHTLETLEDWEAANAAIVANAERNDRYAEQIRAILTPQQRARAERLTDAIPELRERLGMRNTGQTDEHLRLRRASVEETVRRHFEQQQEQGGAADIFVPGPDSWRPGMPIPEEYRQQRNLDRRFPRPGN